MDERNRADVNGFFLTVRQAKSAVATFHGPVFGGHGRGRFDEAFPLRSADAHADVQVMQMEQRLPLVVNDGPLVLVHEICPSKMNMSRRRLDESDAVILSPFFARVKAHLGVCPEWEDSLSLQESHLAKRDTFAVTASLRLGREPRLQTRLPGNTIERESDRAVGSNSQNLT